MVLLTALLNACVGTARPTAPPPGAQYELPWGAVPVETWDRPNDDQLSKIMVESMQAKIKAARSTDPDARIPYRVLTLSGGGARGAYGAGVLAGWTHRGDRPQFDTVTGISTGALMATPAFLGSEYDDDLALYSQLDNDDVFTTRSKLTSLTRDALFDTAPLRATLAGLITQQTLELVAVEYRKGRRLFIGTTNLDANTFTIWNMGKIAASDRQDKLKRYIDVVLASASFPIVFPPVYIEVEGENGTYTQMHTDGGVRETVFFYDFVDELRAAIDAAGLAREELQAELFLLYNGPIFSKATYNPVDGRVLSIAAASIESLMRKVTLSSLYRLWVLTLSRGADFHLSFIPPEYPLGVDPLNFDPMEMAALYEFGYQRALAGDAWDTQVAPTTLEELKELIDPSQSIDKLEARPWLRKDVE